MSNSGFVRNQRNALVDATDGPYGTMPVWDAITFSRRLSLKERMFMTLLGGKATGRHECPRFPPVDLAEIKLGKDVKHEQMLRIAADLQKRGYIMLQNNMVFMTPKVFEEDRERLFQIQLERQKDL